MKKLLLLTVGLATFYLGWSVCDAFLGIYPDGKVPPKMFAHDTVLLLCGCGVNELLSRLWPAHSNKKQ